MAREVQSVFPDVNLSNMLVVPTCQQADYDLVRTGEKIENEKDRLLERVRCCKLSAAKGLLGVTLLRAVTALQLCTISIHC